MILFLFLFNFFLRWSSLAASHTFLVNFLFFDFFLLSSFLFFLLMTKFGPHSVGPTPNLTPNGQPPLQEPYISHLMPFLLEKWKEDLFVLASGDYILHTNTKLHCFESKLKVSRWILHWKSLDPRVEMCLCVWPAAKINGREICPSQRLHKGPLFLARVI